MPEEDLPQKITAVFAEVKELRTICAAQKAQFEKLRSHYASLSSEAKRLDELRSTNEATIDEKNAEILRMTMVNETWRMDSEFYRCELVKLRKQLEDLQAQHKSAEQYVCEIEAKISRRDLQATKLISVLRRKVGTSRVCLVALKAAYKVLPVLNDKVKLERLLAMAKKTRNRAGLEKEMTDCLKEAGFFASYGEPGITHAAEFEETANQDAKVASEDHTIDYEAANEARDHQQRC